jgi:hypothetical protein
MLLLSLGGYMQLVGQPLLQNSLQLPHVGPVVIGSDSAQDCDVLTDAPGISGAISVLTHQCSPTSVCIMGLESCYLSASTDSGRLEEPTCTRCVMQGGMHDWRWCAVASRSAAC